MLKAQYLLIGIAVCSLVALGWFSLDLIDRSQQVTSLVVLPAQPAAGFSTAAPASQPDTPTPPPAPGYNSPLLDPPTQALPTATPLVVSMNLNDNSQRPFIPNPAEHWAAADLTKAEVTLYKGDTPQQLFQMSYGRGDTANTTTYPGLFTVYAKDASLHQSVVKGEHIRYWVGFDRRWVNGFHSVIMDSSGTVVDNRLGQPISSGCIRTALPDAQAIFDWLPAGAHVWVHY
jgi:lipoprotein-anchoring transpeptidase ErfK/SrfK